MTLFHSIEINDLEIVALRDIEKNINEGLPLVKDFDYYTNWFGTVVNNKMKSILI